MNAEFTASVKVAFNTLLPNLRSVIRLVIAHKEMLVFIQIQVQVVELVEK